MWLFFVYSLFRLLRELEDSRATINTVQEKWSFCQQEVVDLRQERENVKNICAGAEMQIEAYKVCMYVCVYACMCVHMHVHVFVYTFVCVCIYIYIYTHTHT